MKISVFLSFPQPHLKVQEDFISNVKDALREKNLEPRTLGVSDYDLDAPLTAIRRLMLESSGLLTIAFKRTLISEGIYKANSDLGITPHSIKDQWLTSPYCHIEPAMAFQIGLPLLILRERDVIAEGVLEKGVLGTYMPDFNSADFCTYFKTEEWVHLLDKWERQVKAVYEKRGLPPKLF